MKTRHLTSKALFLTYSLGVVICLVMQVAVAVQNGPRVYASPPWALVFPIGLFVSDFCAVHLSLRGNLATAIGVAFSSGLFGLILPAVIALTTSGNIPVRYIAFVVLGVLVLFAVLWTPLPRVL